MKTHIWLIFSTIFFIILLCKHHPIRNLYIYSLVKVPRCGIWFRQIQRQHCPCVIGSGLLNFCKCNSREKKMTQYFQPLPYYIKKCIHVCNGFFSSSDFTFYYSCFSFYFIFFRRINFLCSYFYIEFVFN